MEKTRRPDGTGRKKGNGNRSIYAEKKQERKKQEAIGERKTGRGRGTVGKTETGDNVSPMLYAGAAMTAAAVLALIQRKRRKG